MGQIICRCGETFDKNDWTGYEAHKAECASREDFGFSRCQGGWNFYLSGEGVFVSDENAPALLAELASRTGHFADLRVLLSVVAPRCPICAEPATKYQVHPYDGKLARRYGCDVHWTLKGQWKDLPAADAIRRLTAAVR